MLLVIPTLAAGYRLLRPNPSQSPLITNYIFTDYFLEQMAGCAPAYTLTRGLLAPGFRLLTPLLELLEPL
jgi:hypothetical protein